MSKLCTQITYECKCEEGYGTTCGKQSRFVLYYIGSIDASTIYHKRHIEDKDSKYNFYQPGQYIQNPEIEALQKLLNTNPDGDNKEKIDPKFFEEL